MKSKDRKYQQIKAKILQAVLLYMHAEKDIALEILSDALAVAEPYGLVRIFTEEGELMKKMLSEAAHLGLAPNYIRTILATQKVAG